MSNQDSVAIIGAGPVGLFTAFLLAQQGVKVAICEKEGGINQSPRAIAYFPSVLEEFAKAGIIADVIDAGEKSSDGVDWRGPDGKVIAGINPPPTSEAFVVFLSQPELAEVLCKRALDTGNVAVFFHETFERLEQRDGTVVYWTKDQNGMEIERQCRYLIGADGGRSAVRRSLGIELPGFTFEGLQFVAVNMQYPLSEQGWKGANFIVDPVDWAVVAKRGKGNRWRYATGIRTPQTSNILDEATVEIVKDRIRRTLPGDTSKIEYETLAPYVVHQRCSTRFQDGNVLLAGDAAHLNNPVGGLGLTTGMLDAAHLGKALIQVLTEGVSLDALAVYAETRRRIFQERTAPITYTNLHRLFSQEPAHVEERESAFAALNDPKDFINMTRVGLPDFALTSTSDKIFDTYGEVTWFISVSKIPEWTDEKFQHEYKSVHADMTRNVNKMAPAPVIRRYVQLANSETTVPGTERPYWNYVTCLTWPSIFILHAGFSDPGYRATAGAHHFCRLDQQGCLASQVEKYLKQPDDKSDIGRVRSLVFHKREGTIDDISASWFAERAAKLKAIAAADDRVNTYILWWDVTPRNTEHLFQDTQFAVGEWQLYKAVETYDFPDEDAARTFFVQHGEEIYGASEVSTQTVIGEPDVIV